MKIKRFLSVITVLSVIFSAVAICPDVIAQKADQSSKIIKSSDTEYINYLNDNNFPNITEEITVFADVENAGLISQDSEKDFSFSAPYDLLGLIEITYMTADDNVTDIELSLKINGQTPFYEAGNLVVERLWRNNPDELNGEKYLRDEKGNEIPPSQAQTNLTNTILLSDDTGSYVSAYNFAFKNGFNTITIKSIRNSIKITEIKICPSEDLPDYKEYISEKTGSDYNGDVIVIQGESADIKSSSVIIPNIDKSTPATIPSDAYNDRVNTIGGNSWNAVGNWIEWNVEVPQNGFYAIGIKYRQNIVSGMFSARTLYINGEIPFYESAFNEFEYSSKWQADFLGNGDGIYKFYLNKGKNTIRMQVCLGQAAYYLGLGKESVKKLNSAYRQIIMLTSTTPDSLRNYRIDKNCPEAMEIIKSEAEVISEISAGLAKISGKKGSINTSIDNLKLQLDSFVKEPMSIPSRLDAFRSNITAFSDAIYSLSEQPLEIDYITLSNPNAENIPEINKISASLWEYIKFEAAAYLASFKDDYSADDTGDKNTIEVWSAHGRDQATVLKRLIDIDFTPKTDIKVDLKMVANTSGVSTLLLATVSGFGPDLAVGIANSNAVDYGLRNTACDLSQMKNFEEISRRFNPNAMTPFIYNDGCYALPLTYTFPMMFYRTDLLSEMSISIPETWDELYRIMGDLQKNYMTVGIPSDMGYFATHIYQNGGKLYSDDMTRSLFDSTVSMDVFADWSNLYVSYGLPIDYDAANRFRTGEMPIVIADYSFYNTISVLAPEIKGNWEFTTIPATVSEDGTFNISAASTGNCAMLLSTSKKKEESYEFLDWLTSDKTQSEFSRNIECRLGIAARYQTANTSVLSDIGWTKGEYETIKLQWDNSAGIPEVPGGYYVARSINNALRNVVSYQNDSAEVLKEYTESINDEITKKREQYNLD